MTALVILITLCLGQDCRTERVPAEGGLLGCYVEAQARAAELLRPGERVARIRCEAGERA